MNLFSDEELAPASVSPNSSSEPQEIDFSIPLAARLRPRTFEEFAGQKHLIGDNAPLRRAANADRVPSCIFFGSAGVGKTTLARLLAKHTKSHFEEFSAITGGVADVRKIVEAAKIRKRTGRKTLLFVDEIHRFNRAQQDAFLPHVEDGTVVLLGATTENPLAALNTPLLSRCRLFPFEPLTEEDILELLKHAFEDERGLKNLDITFEEAALTHIARMSNGDARLALGALEVAADLTVGGVLTLETATQALGKRALPYDLHGDNHYDTISAYIKSLRGSDPDAALFWLMRMLEGGEDPMFVARRLVIQASEDVGMADSLALLVSNAAMNAVEKIGMPEAAIPLAHATVFLATAPKSNAAYMGMHRAKAAVLDGQAVRVPQHLRSTGLGKKLGNGEGYIYPHDYEGHFVPQDYLPPEVKSQLEREAFYQPSEVGQEAKIARRLQTWWGESQTTPSEESPADSPEGN